MNAPDTFAAGKVIANRYEIISVLGRGGMGTVYEAVHLTLRKNVALKTLDLTRGDIDPKLVGRFFIEAQAAAAIGHPNIVEVFDLGQDGDVVYLAMERLEGEELADRVQRRGRLPAPDVARIGADLADAIAAAHARDIIHRDIKPQNVFLAVKGRHTDIVKVLDFGIAKLASTESPALSLTKTGEIFGTPLYMSPEQMNGARDIDTRTDVYSIGVLLWEALAGRAPFEADTFPQLVVKVLTEEPPPLRDLAPDVPDELAALIEHAMRKSRSDRLGTARELSDRLAEIARRVGSGGAVSSYFSSAPPAPGARPPAVLGTATTGLVATVRAASAPAPSRQSSRTVGLAISTVLVAVIALAVGYRTLRAHPEAPTRAPTPHLATTVVPAATLAPPVVIAPATPDASPPLAARVQIQSVPSGAEVWTLGGPSCQTPCELTIPAEGATIVAQRRGYRRTSVEVTQPVTSPVRITLERAPHAAEPDEPPPLLPR